MVKFNLVAKVIDQSKKLVNIIVSSVIINIWSRISYHDNVVIFQTKRHVAMVTDGIDGSNIMNNTKMVVHYL